MVSVLLLSSVLVAIPRNGSAAWGPIAYLSYSPTSAYVDQITGFNFVIQNEGDKSFDMTDFTIHFDWQATNMVYDLLDSTLSFAPGTSHTFDMSVRIPQISTGAHTFTAKGTGQAVGDWFSSDVTWNPATITIMSVPILNVACSANPTSGTSPLSVQFTSTVSGGLTPYTYSWTFGDGSTSSTANPMHTYTSAGTYTVTLVVTDTETNRQIESSTATITVSSPSIFGPDGGIGSLAILLIAAIVIIVVVVIVVLVAKKPKKGEGSQPPMQQPPLPPQNP
jgi:PKD repeat protein